MLLSDSFLKERHHFNMRKWVLDSGAFSAHNSGTKIDIRDYAYRCSRLLREERDLEMVFALDVIGNHRASLHNAEKLWELGINAVPTFHLGEPWEFLKHIAKYYPKIALGGMAREDKEVKIEFFKRCFGLVWPKKMHGFGTSEPEVLMQFPFHSVDSNSWEFAPLAKSMWTSFDRQQMYAPARNFPDRKIDIRREVKYFLDLEDQNEDPLGKGNETTR